MLRKGQAIKTTHRAGRAGRGPAARCARAAGRHPLTGSKVANLSPAVAEEVGIDDDMREGVVVLEVKDQTPAARLGVKRGDIVVGINDEKVKSVAQLAAALRCGRRRLAAVGRARGKVFNLAIQG